MTILENTELGKKTIVKNVNGYIIDHIKWFDTETKLAEIYASIPLKKEIGGKIEKSILVQMGPPNVGLIDKVEHPVVTFICKLIGCDAYDIKTGETIK